MRTNETNGIDLSPLFESPIIKKIAEVSQKLPVPQPSVLSRVWEGKKAQILNINLNIKMSENGGKFPLTNKDAALKAPLYFANIPLERIVSVKIVNTTTTQESVLEVKPLLLPSQLPPSPKEEKISIDLPDTKSVSVYKAEDSIQQEKIMNRNNYFQSEYKPKQVKKFPIIALLCGIILGLIWGLILGVALERITAISENLIMRQENFEIPKGEQPQSQKNQSHTIELKNSEKQKKTNNINVGKK
ncbi:MAG: hypothetical protein LBT05_07390 [Planctomycetaceae bacterium]|nr:hypothetical protein [Planctomycetaceae bacterium]